MRQDRKGREEKSMEGKREEMIEDEKGMEGKRREKK